MARKEEFLKHSEVLDHQISSTSKMNKQKKRILEKEYEKLAREIDEMKERISKTDKENEAIQEKIKMTQPVKAYFDEKKQQ